jgi:hypothetical protein
MGWYAANDESIRSKRGTIVLRAASARAAHVRPVDWPIAYDPDRGE